jgi:hypothetical protein
MGGIEIANIIVTVILGIIATVILVSQYRLQRHNWRLALYDKRYPVYLKTVEFIASIVGSAHLSSEELTGFLRNVRDREFLFGEDIHEFIKSLYEHGVNLRACQEHLKVEPLGEIRDRRAEEEGEILKWFADQFKPAKELFGKYLKMESK